jgi:ParB-like chromosome segregation protein Spo0J
VSLLPPVHSIAEIWPIMRDDELDALAADISLNGQLVPIVMVGGAILDGRNRWLACKLAGVTPWVEEIDPVGRDLDALAWSYNEHRRHLPVQVRALAAARRANMKEGRPSLTSANALVSQKAAAEQFGVSVDAVKRAKTVLDHGDQGLIEAVESGDVSVSAAATAVRRIVKEVALGGVKLPTPKQAEALSREQGGAHIVGSDGKFHVYLTNEQRQLKDDWFAFKERLFGWVEFGVPPARALAAIPDYQRTNVGMELEAALRWLEQFSQCWGKANAS